ncbi:hypothetical protein COY95_01945 [Candidatus Woesearchaeota archaeon CG_4_10_14_0_8_um_filter_47_5]|nr:MAG: hypothetical protein COY95_01945 [Candidatus Woesearchaeota archaeon CG_4_10_14_0_8_um_filter_47_5]
MPHQCVRCNTFYPDGAKEILSGCTCGGRLFFFIKKEKYEAMQKEQPAYSLSHEEKRQIESDVYDLLGTSIDPEKPVILDLESIRILKPGKYELDLVRLFKKKHPLVYRLEEGKYIIDLVESFKSALDPENPPKKKE